jgi:hypothetical protein
MPTPAGRVAFPVRAARARLGREPGARAGGCDDRRTTAKSAGPGGPRLSVPFSSNEQSSSRHRVREPQPGVGHTGGTSDQLPGHGRRRKGLERARTGRQHELQLALDALQGPQSVLRLTAGVRDLLTNHRMIRPECRRPHDGGGVRRDGGSANARRLRSIR